MTEHDVLVSQPTHQTDKHNKHNTIKPGSSSDTPDENLGDLELSKCKSFRSLTEVDGNPHGSTPGDHPDTPKSKRRKLDSDQEHKALNRAVSPPWKSFSANGPTTFTDNGKRRSGRTNALPLELQPRSGKAQTRSSKDNNVKKEAPPKSSTSKHKSTPSNASQASRISNRQTRNVTTPSTMKKELEQKSRTSHYKQEPSSTRKSARIPTKSKREVSLIKEESISVLEDSDSELSSRPVTPPRLLRKISFKVRAPKPTIFSPANIPLPRVHGSVEAFLEQDKIEEPGAKQPLSPQQIRKEAADRLWFQRKSSGKDINSLAQLGRQTGPPREYAHHDHLLAHIKYFKRLQKDEAQKHISNAKIIAHEAKAYIEAKQSKTLPVTRVKTAAEIEIDVLASWTARYRAVTKDLVKLWSAVEIEVNAIRLKQYQKEQGEIRQRHLNRFLEHADADVEAMKGSLQPSAQNSDTETTDVDESEATQLDSDEDVSDDESGSDTKDTVADEDADLDVEKLRDKYKDLPDVPPDVQQDTVDDTSDTDVTMDSEFDSGDESDSDTQADADQDEQEDEEGQSSALMSFFSKAQRKEMGDLDASQEAVIQDDKPVQEMDLVDESIMTEIHVTEPDGRENLGDKENQIDTTAAVSSAEHDPVAEHNLSTSELAHQNTDDAGLSREPSTNPGSSETKVDEAESASSFEHMKGKETPFEQDHKQSSLIPISPLLRGTLRTYQHEGLDWLAKLYAAGRSGILADEMGLGKTIQSISLLAHLATTYEVWGPHLVVVPTSVMLNWEMEFKKFLPGFKILTYYGSQDERQRKRRGWMAEDNFNVCITSYQLVLKDAQSFKRRKWHYMILDEAHNIKNFKSERWKTMMTFNTRARLLLTGTPLQNNLTELWSLLFFLRYDQDPDGEDEFAGLTEWTEWFKKPVDSILEHNKQVLDREDREQIAKLHKVIRPFLLRRLKRDVEKQMPLKYEHVEMCRLSKRQRQLYDGFMSRAQTRETLASGNYLSIINALMQLRKVCNHPDLFETRPINTSFAMPRSVASRYDTQDLLNRKRFLSDHDFDSMSLKSLRLVPISNEGMSRIQWRSTNKLNACLRLCDLVGKQQVRLRDRNIELVMTDRSRAKISLETAARFSRLQAMQQTNRYNNRKTREYPMYGTDLQRIVRVRAPGELLGQQTTSDSLQPLLTSVAARSRSMRPLIEQFACITPIAAAVDMSTTIIPSRSIGTLRDYASSQLFDPFHQPRMKLSIAFPDKRLLQYDCGKLQRLATLLRKLQSGGHRALIFTQMTKVLDILEQFLNIHGHLYLRLDGATKIEQRQILTDRFNNDPRILCFILSSRSGGLGINLTGADTVIFYDLDWNPAMDRQCTDRAHRIGQTRDVHIYRFVSEHTIEQNILRKANQKQLLDDVVIQDGDFTTDHINNSSDRGIPIPDDENDVAGAAMDRVLGNLPGAKANNVGAASAFEQAEEKEDIDAAKIAAREVQTDEGDFDEAVAAKTDSKADDPYKANEAAIEEVEADSKEPKHIDEYMIKMMTLLLKDVPLAIIDKDKKRRKRDRKRERR